MSSCLKPTTLCVCEGVTPIDNKVGLLILQHPQEQDRLLGTARLATLHLTNSAFRIGLSWPSLAKALGRRADPAEWAILHLGSTKGWPICRRIANSCCSTRRASPFPIRTCD